jgi:hypothetical protein
MKTRNGFVSNSSSSSFCIIGVEDESLLKALAKAEKLHFRWNGDPETELARGCNHKIDKTDQFCKVCGKPAYVEKEVKVNYNDLGHGVCDGEIILFFGNGYYPYNAGIHAPELLNKMTIPQAAEYFCKLVKNKLNIDINPAQVQLLYGEASSE